MASGSVMLLLLLLLLGTASARKNDTELAKDEEVDAAVELDRDVLDVQSEETEQPVESSTIMEEQDSQETRVKPNVTSTNHTETGFMPSVHLGPIIADPELFGNDRHPTRSPFNSIEPNNQPGNSLFNSVRAIKFGNGQSDNEPKPHRKTQQPPFRPSEEDASYVKFVDENNEEEHPHRYQAPSSNTQAKGGVHKNVADTRHGEPHEQQVQLTYVDDNYYSGQQQQYQQQYSTYETKPTKFHEAPAYGLPYQQALVPGENAYAHQYQQSQHDPYNTDDHQKLVQPETVINVHPVSYQTTSYDALTNPKTIVYVTSHETTRTRKVPFPYYQPQVFEHTEAAPVVLPEHTEPYPYPIFYEPQQKSVSPWKKILHIIGAFLPLGLLLALLSPRVITADPNADPNIILSKLRVNDLPAEHKNNRLVSSQTDECEERSICRLVNAADPTSANFLRHLLVHVAERTPESAVRKKELDRIFEAAKLGNCDILTCGFYDGT
ncbi:RNA polymerase II degradation factor 1-like [Nasonia vitripennis]|uniref:Uncharacterized protein n=1 Tax=Nasonia vitripennis TaxID=7425 RepID=A0A7M7QGG2_NASVI|nr:RNA polymerase II degradation factor 1-like [Nasonia vitripennis]